MVLFTRRNIIADKRIEAEQAFEELTREIDDALDAIASEIKDVIDNVFVIKCKTVNHISAMI